MGQMLAYRPMKRLVPLALAVLASTAFAREPTASIDVTLEPGKVHEACERLEKGDKRLYHWKATAPVDFNIHFHEADDVHYPVKRDAMRGDGGTFAAPRRHDYCWMWTARGATARVTGQVLR